MRKTLVLTAVLLVTLTGCDLRHGTKPQERVVHIDGVTCVEAYKAKAVSIDCNFPILVDPN